MKRGKFLKKIGIGMAALAVVPMMMAEAVDPKQTYAHIVITPEGQCGINVTYGFWDRSLSLEEINKLNNLTFDPADVYRLLKEIPVSPVDLWINGKQVMMNGKIT